jgi:hypothetical protein
MAAVTVAEEMVTLRVEVAMEEVVMAVETAEGMVVEVTVAGTGEVAKEVAVAVEKAVGYLEGVRGVEKAVVVKVADLAVGSDSVERVAVELEVVMAEAEMEACKHANRSPHNPYHRHTRCPPHPMHRLHRHRYEPLHSTLWRHK